MFVRYDCKDKLFHNILNLLVQLQIHAGIYLGLGLGLFIFQDLLILRKFCLLIHTNQNCIFLYMIDCNMGLTQKRQSCNKKQFM